jgi:hypothetical protein
MDDLGVIGKIRLQTHDYVSALECVVRYEAECSLTTTDLWAKAGVRHSHIQDRLTVVSSSLPIFIETAMVNQLAKETSLAFEAAKARAPARFDIPDSHGNTVKLVLAWCSKSYADLRPCRYINQLGFNNNEYRDLQLKVVNLINREVYS